MGFKIFIFLILTLSEISSTWAQPFADSDISKAIETINTFRNNMSQEVLRNGYTYEFFEVRLSVNLYFNLIGELHFKIYRK